MRHAIAGGTGMIGTQLAAVLRERGDEVIVLTRGEATGAHQVRWDTVRGIAEPGRLEGLDGFFNLAGAPIANRPWTKARRKVLAQSRVDATATLIRSLEKLSAPPKVFVGAGGLGLFGDRGDDVIDDDEPAGKGFLADLCAGWEEAHLSSRRLGCRACVLRMSVVLSPRGGVFPLIVVPFRVGLGGWLGNGRQYTAWIGIRDAVGAMVHLLDHGACEGCFNGTVPEPIPNKDWCRALGRALHRPVLGHTPAWALRGALGDLADELFLASVRAVPKKLLDTGYNFVDPDADATFRWLLSEMGTR